MLEVGKRDGQLLYPNRVAVVKTSGDIIVTERSVTVLITHVCFMSPTVLRSRVILTRLPASPEAASAPAPSKFAQAPLFLTRTFEQSVIFLYFSNLFKLVSYPDPQKMNADLQPCYYFT